MLASVEAKVKAAQGGGFLLEDLRADEVFTPEDFSHEQIQTAKTAAEFALNEVLPAAAEIEAKNFTVTRALLRKAGDLGLLSVDIPEAYGGLEMDKVTSALVAESMSRNGSFAVAFSAHSSIGTLPLLWYGTEPQKQKYLPRLATGELVAAYALSEASSGSDAMNIRTRATLSADGRHYILNGEKMWISNCGFADLFTVFAKIDGEKFSAFLVDRTSPGLSIGAEEHKLGIRGSSTCPLILSDCQVPAENLLGEIGKGHHIAFNILNIGRFKLGAAAVGAARHSLQQAVRYAKDRKAFGKPISDFGLIQEKLAESAAGIYVGEALSYRTVGMIDAAVVGLTDARDIQKRIEEYAVECSILKVWGSEMLDTVVDHMVQIYGGFGYVEDYPAAAAYRDARINRIFEGTNEINRLIITGFLLKRAVAGKLPLLPAIKRIMDEVMESPASYDDTEGPLANERKVLTIAKKLTLFAAGAASQKHMLDMPEQQEIMGALADCIIQVYAMESALLRTEKTPAKHAIALTQFHAARAMQTVEASAKKVIAAVAEGDMLRTQLALLRRIAKYEIANVVALSRQIAKHVVEAAR
jgi:butyryl-CoA dehydrogenase